MGSMIKYNNQFFIPYLGGYNCAGTEIYISNELPAVADFSIVRYEGIHDALVLHELVEVQLLSKGYFDSYNEAHAIAVAAESRFLSAIGVPIDEYYGFIEAQTQEHLKQFKSQKLETPPDLCLLPYREDGSHNPILQRLFKKLESTSFCQCGKTPDQLH
jgi:hypothetical protein